MPRGSSGGEERAEKGKLKSSEEVRRSVERLLNELAQRAAQRPALRKKWRPFRLRFAGREVPWQWRSWWFMPHGFRVKPDPTAVGDHWQGGEPRHEGATCAFCHATLSLIWDIDCSDSRFPPFFGEKLAPLNRLPLYYCCQCPDETEYKILSPTRIETTPLPGNECFGPGPDENFLEDVPPAFPRRKISLEPIPEDVERLLCDYMDSEKPEMTSADLERIANCLETETSGRFGSYISEFSQFGGAPLLYQGPHENECPNEQCEARMPWHEVYEWTSHERMFLMKSLAVVCEDSQLEMNMNCAQIGFDICWNCLTVRAEVEVT